MRCLSTRRDAAWGTLRRDCGHVRRLITGVRTPAIGPRPARPLDGAPGRRTRATVATSTHARGRRGCAERHAGGYHGTGSREIELRRTTPISDPVVGVRRPLGSRDARRRARSRVARRTCIICKITHETHGTCSKHRLQNAAVASTQNTQAVPSRSRSLLRRPNCLHRTTPVSAWRTPSAAHARAAPAPPRHGSLGPRKAASPRVGCQHLERQRIVAPAARDRLALANQRLADAAAALAFETKTSSSSGRGAASAALLL